MEELRKGIEDLKEAQREQQRKKEEKKRKEEENTEQKKEATNAYLDASIERFSKVRDDGVQAIDKNKELIWQLRESAKRLRKSVAQGLNDDDNVESINAEDELELSAEYARFTLVQPKKKKQRKQSVPTPKNDDNFW